jgi:hypothetical protein
VRPPRRFYLDTSVIGGYYDAEFAEATRRLFATLASGRVIGVISDLVLAELVNAPDPVRELVAPNAGVTWERVDESEASLELADAYLSAGIVTVRFRDDCRHVAIATVQQVDVLVSWNFRHIVQYERIVRFNAVSALHGYDAIEIRSPPELIYDED